MFLHRGRGLLTPHLGIGVSLGITAGRLVSGCGISGTVGCLRNIASCRLLVRLIGIAGGTACSLRISVSLRITVRLGIAVRLCIAVTVRITCRLGLCISCLAISVLCKSTLSGIACVFRNAGCGLSAGHLGSLVIPHRLVSLHLSICTRLGISLRIGILLLILVLIALLILISLLCGISGIGGSAGIVSLRITVLLRIPCLIGVLIFLSHIFSFPLGR